MATDIYHLKKDWADGRFFMRKIATPTKLSHQWGDRTLFDSIGIYAGRVS